MRTELSLFEQCRSALAAWHDGQDPADASRFESAFVPDCNVLIHCLTHRSRACANTWSDWNAAISNEMTDTIDEVNAYRARRKLTGGKRSGPIVPAVAAVDTPEASVEAAQTLRGVRRALTELPPLRRWAYVARQNEPLDLLTRREIAAKGKSKVDAE